jgi:hypothetical protein
VRPESYGGGNFHLRYTYPVLPGKKINMLNMLSPMNWVALVLYHSDPHYAALFEVGFDGPAATRKFFLLDGANLERQGERWAVKNILNGGESTWPDLVEHVDSISTTPVVIVDRAKVTRTNAECQFPPPGQEFTAIAVSSEKSNWAFRDGLTDGIPFKTQSGPFENTDLKSVPSRQVFMNTYGP